ncbi:cysteine methyltransferase [Campylobacter ornithocola]|uniref:Methylated-DNA--protein-cysteine methyltransferase n=1 Tax=Campylobacter ornithocola TaxID=1848766 RepID=A0A6M8MZ66_9BACT|nr:methylated-DNA--[protein]-cysteine S-methyltransferase [Campylobacter ornithocola]OCX42246.1 cysteine methyltransferase [Campylobacter ornithocola]QKF57549.1 O6-alkylguanine-DNA-alkyltransferase [Campylobacter ornithocola]
MYQSFYKANFAYILLQSNENKLVNVDFTTLKPDFTKQKHPILEQALEELDLYFSQKLFTFSTPLSIHGSEFEQKVYKALTKIPYGQTKTYQEIAIFINHPKAFRAVGNANSKNKLAIFIPCHRVVAKNHLGGYNGGLDIKIKLLQLEGSLND